MPVNGPMTNEEFIKARFSRTVGRLLGILETAVSPDTEPKKYKAAKKPFLDEIYDLQAVLVEKFK